MVDKAQDIKIHEIDRAFDLHYIFFSHLAAFGIFDDRNAAVQCIKVQIFINIHAPSGLNVVKHEAFRDTSDV